MVRACASSITHWSFSAPPMPDGPDSHSSSAVLDPSEGPYEEPNEKDTPGARTTSVVTASSPAST